MYYGSVEEHVRKRLHWMKVGSAHEFERIRKDGTVSFKCEEIRLQVEAL